MDLSNRSTRINNLRQSKHNYPLHWWSQKCIVWLKTLRVTLLGVDRRKSNQNWDDRLIEPDLTKRSHLYITRCCAIPQGSGIKVDSCRAAVKPKNTLAILEKSRIPETIKLMYRITRGMSISNRQSESTRVRNSLKREEKGCIQDSWLCGLSTSVCLQCQ